MSLPHIKRPALVVAFATGLLIAGVAVAGFSLTGKVELTDRNCERIELLKRIQREALQDSIVVSRKFLLKNPAVKWQVSALWGCIILV